MGEAVAGRFLRLLAARGMNRSGARVLVMGFAFKEDCPDIRNTRVIDVVRQLAAYGVAVDVHDPWADAEEAERQYGVRLVEEPAEGAYQGAILAVAHRRFRALGAETLRRYLAPDGIFFDVKSVFPPEASDLRL
jgi:UDP-N-acetyl-D-galactosamine dehydrogenase